jgi:predicted HTH domain antitoxin
MSIDIEDDILRAAGMTPDGLKLEVAVLLFQKGLTLGQASQVAGMSQFDFQHVLASRRIPVHYDEDDYRDDVESLGELGRL